MNYGKYLSAVCFIFILFIYTVYAQIPAPAQHQPVAISGATIYTMTGQIIREGTIVFKDGRITMVGTDVEIPGDAVRYDARGKHVYPGLIDAYTNMGLTEIGAVDVTSDFNEHGTVNPNVRAEKAFHPESEHIPVARSHGIAVTFSSPSGGTISGLSAAMMMDGWTWEGMTLHAPLGLMIQWPVMSGSNNGGREQLEEIEDAFRKARAYYKARVESDNHPTDMRWEAMIPVLNREIPVVVQANDARQIQDAITWSESEDVRLIILGGRDAHYVAHHLVAKKIPVIITSVLSSPDRPWQGYDDVYSSAARLYDAGIPFAIAGEYGSANAMRLRHHAATAAGFGLPAEEAIKSITLHPAEIFGLADRIGTLETGKDATLIITDGDLLDLRTSVEQMFIRGRTIDMTDKQKNLFERYREKYLQMSES
jgi:imidazolonepropionase-like amidohydrolase